MPKTCEKPLYKIIRVVLFKKPLEKTTNIGEMRELFERTTSHSKEEPAYSLERDRLGFRISALLVWLCSKVCPHCFFRQSYCNKKTDEMIILLKSQGWYH